MDRFRKEIGSEGFVMSSTMAVAGFIFIGLDGRQEITKVKGIVPVDRDPCALYVYVSSFPYWSQSV